MYRLSKKQKSQGLSKILRVNTENSISQSKKLKLKRNINTESKQNTIKTNNLSTRSILSTYRSFKKLDEHKIVALENRIGTMDLLRVGDDAQLQLMRRQKAKIKYYPILINKSIQKRHLKVDQHNVIIQYFSQIFTLCEQIYKQIYQYVNVEKKFKSLHRIIVKVGSQTLIYRGYAFTGLLSFEYGSFSLSLFYFDRALKTFYEKHKKMLFQRKVQLQIYKCLTRIFLLKNNLELANKFAYRYLRKSWFLNDIDAQMTALDLLGKISMQSQQLSLSRYFHDKMCKLKKNSKQLVQISNQELIKVQQQKVQFLYYQTVEVFVEKDQRFNQILKDYFKNQSIQYSKRKGQLNPYKTIFLCTHRSPNRKLKNYRVLQRKLIEQKQSKQLHFVNPNETRLIGSIVTQFSKLICQTKKIINNSKYDKLIEMVNQSSETQSNSGL